MMDDEKIQRPEEGSVEKRERREKPLPGSGFLSYLHDLIYILAAVMVIFLLLFRVVVVSGDSMYDTLLDGDYLLLVDRQLAGALHQGDVVVACKSSFRGGEPIVKRVIATGGQTVDIDFDMGVVYVDGVALEEDYTHTPTNLEEGMTFPLTVEENHVFLMGDNRNDSMDSRSQEIGQVDVREIMGKVVFLLFPGTDEGEQPRDFGRIGGV